MTAIWVVQHRDDTRTYHNTNEAATQAAADANATSRATQARTRPNYPPFDTAVAYRIDIEPAPRGDAYWDRTTRKAAA